MIDFPEFYQSVHGYRPFGWQAFVANRIVENGWPASDVLDPPTAAGKTSMIDIAIYALAAQCNRVALERTAPLRTFFVIDRRLVVDDVTRHALKVANTIEEKAELRDIRERLLRFGGARPLAVTTLRGGMYHDDSWADLPNQPLVCVSTVDQVGSRLLFRGYGVSERRRPIDAGLLGCDSLFIVDEAHLSQPFLQTLGWVTKYAGWGEQTPAPTPRVLEMTATPTRASEFRLPADIYEQDDKLSPRLKVEKRAELWETADIVGEASGHAKRMMSLPAVEVVGIVVNRVDTARAIFEKLRDDADGAVLLTGRIRPYDRDKLISRFLGRMKAGRASGQHPLFVVATQTVEVGADLDFDVLISEAAPLDALRQRFGRLNRLGNKPASEAVILKRRQKKGENDSIYGESLETAWNWLNKHAVTEGKQSWIDFGALRMKELYRADPEPRVNSVARDGPVMLPAHVETWVQTCPGPEPDPEVAPFLHGPERDAPDVNVVWRADLSADVTGWRKIVEAAPPLSTEALPLPIWAARKWLAGQRTTDVADVDAGGEDGGDTRPAREYLIWRGPDDRAQRGIRPGDTIVVRSSEGGTDDFGWAPECTDRVKDIGDDCANERARLGGGRYRVRLHPEVFAPAEGETTSKLKELLDALKNGDDDARADLIKLAEARCDKARGWRLVPYSDAVCAVSRWAKPEDRKKPAPTQEDSNDDDSASFTEDEIELERHVRDVVSKVRLFAEKCGLDAPLRQALVRAAELHDLGKWDARFQEMLDPRRDPNLAPLAKSKGRGSPAERSLRRQYARYPEDARHEFWSVALAEEGGLLVGNEFRDLIQYLIGTHHGYGRPMTPFWTETDTVTAGYDGRKITAREVTRFMEFGSGWVDTFWSLNRRYGYWGLAYLEAILRRADCVASREEEEHGHEQD